MQNGSRTFNECTLPEDQSFFADVNGSVVSMKTTMSELCDRNLESGSFLYIRVKT